MAHNHDTIIIGGGHNGLTCAALLARQGRKVLVLEHLDRCGGLATSTEFHPGYHTPGILHDTSHIHKNVIDKLGLTRHGLEYADPAPVFAPTREGPGLLLSELAGTDAEQFARFDRFIGEVKPFVSRLLREPPPHIAPQGFRQTWALARKAWGLRRLGPKTMHELLRIAPMSVADWLDEHFDDQHLKATLAAPALASTWCGPRSAGTAALLLMHTCSEGAEIAGGSPALIRALLAACQASGVEIRTSATVQRILVERGEQVGVELGTGERLTATQLVATTDPRSTFSCLIRPTDLPPGIGQAIAHWRCRGTAAKLHLALDGPLEFASRPGASFSKIRIGEDLDSLERAFDAIKYRNFSDHPYLDIQVHGETDKPTVSILAQFVPQEREGGWDETARATLTEAIIERLADFAPSLRDRIVGHELLTPNDLSQRYGLTGGHLHHGEHALDQMWWLRPLASCARFATPVKGLWLGGSGSHPGGGITCGPGALAAAAILG